MQYEARISIPSSNMQTNECYALRQKVRQISPNRLLQILTVAWPWWFSAFEEQISKTNKQNHKLHICVLEFKLICSRHMGVNILPVTQKLRTTIHILWPWNFIIWNTCAYSCPDCLTGRWQKQRCHSNIHHLISKSISNWFYHFRDPLVWMVTYQLRIKIINKILLTSTFSLWRNAAIQNRMTQVTLLTKTNK